MTKPEIKYVAELAHVREVSLLGTADLAFWTKRLEMENLVPAVSDGKAEVLVTAADSKFKGLRFRELSFSVLVSGQEHGIAWDGAYLVQAYNSSRFFAFCERTFFSTPYYHSDVRISAAMPASVQLAQSGEAVFRVQMAADAAESKREPSRTGEDGWEGPVFLPGRLDKKDRQTRLFFAKIRGHTRTYPFLHSADLMKIAPSPDAKFLHALVDSHFFPTEWNIREDASHAKSKTYQRSEMALVMPGAK